VTSVWVLYVAFMVGTSPYIQTWQLIYNSREDCLSGLARVNETPRIVVVKAECRAPK